jgi:hypothetical protein
VEVYPDCAYPLASLAHSADGGVPVAKGAPPIVAEDSGRAPTELLPLDPADAGLIASWTTSLRARGWAPSSIERAAKRVRGLARSAPNGLLQATREDIARFALERAGGQDLGLHDPDRHLEKVGRRSGCLLSMGPTAPASFSTPQSHSRDPTAPAHINKRRGRPCRDAEVRQVAPLPSGKPPGPRDRLAAGSWTDAA